jgi:glycosyltransferase involved in cell wall biosynthesis
MSGPFRLAMIAACPFPWPRGTPIRIHRLAEALARRGHDVHVVTYHLGQADPDLPFPVHRIREVPSYRHTAPGPTLRKLLQLDPMLVRLLRRLHREAPFDLVHAHHYEGLLVAWRARTGLPLIYDAHTTLAGELPQYPLGLPAWVKRALGTRLDRSLPRHADRVIAVSDAIGDMLVAIGGAPANRVHVIPSGVDAERFHVEPAVARDGRTVVQPLPTSVDLLIKAFAILRDRPAPADDRRIRRSAHTGDWQRGWASGTSRPAFPVL